MSLAAPPQRYTPEDLLNLSNSDDFELVSGRLIERKPSPLSSWVAGQIFGLVSQYVRIQKLGWAFPSGLGYRCFSEDRERIRRASASFLCGYKLPHGPTADHFCDSAPDLVIEVVSPSDLSRDVELKVGEWLRAGVPLVWVVNPANRTVLVHRATAPSPQKLTERDDLPGGDVLPDFRCAVNELFPPREVSPT